MKTERWIMERELAINMGILYLKMKDGETKSEAIDRLTDLLESVGIEWNCYDEDEAEVRDW